MRVDLTDGEAAALRDLLDGYLGDLSSEIANTDNPAFRRMLRERRERLSRARAALVEQDRPAAQA